MPVNETPASIVAAASTAPKLLARLATLAEEAGKKIYDRAALVAQLLADRVWIAASFHGDYGAARDDLQARYFGDVCGAVTLGQLLDIHKEFPSRGHWEDRKFNLMLLWNEVLEKRAEGRRPKPPHARPLPKVPASPNGATDAELVARELKGALEEAKKAQARAEKLGSELSAARAAGQAMDARLRTIQSELDALRKENAALKAEVERLKKKCG